MKRLDAALVPLDGIHLVEASAGTGKTHAITSLYLRAVVELGLLPEKILVVTFTRAATAELRERVRLRLRQAQQILSQVLASHDASEPLVPVDSCLEAVSRTAKQTEQALTRLESALLVIDEAAVMTIHGFCARVLDGNAFESRMALSVELLESTAELVEEIVADFVASRLSTLATQWLCLLQRRGLDVESLRHLAKLVMARPHAEVEPKPRQESLDFEECRARLDECRRLTLQWLRDPRHDADLLGFQKSKRGAGMGVRLVGYLEKVSRWLVCPISELDERCDTFEKLRELAEKNQAQVSQELSRFLDLLGRCDVAFDALEQNVQNAALALRFAFVETLTSELERRKRSRRVQSYEDLLERLNTALDGEAGRSLAAALRLKYPLALIDEFQDTDQVQYAVFSRIYAENACLFMIGDPKQSIYAFRGADVENYLRAAAIVGERRHTLDVNYRSDPSVVSALDRLLGEHADPFCGAGIEFVRVRARPGASDCATAGVAQSGVQILWFEDGSRANSAAEMPKYRARALSLQATVRHIEQLLGSAVTVGGRPIQPSDVAVLTRTNRECSLVSHALRQASLSCIETTDGSVLESEAHVSLVRLLRVLLRPSDLRALSSLLLDPVIGTAPHELPTLDLDENALEIWSDRLTRWFKIWGRSGVLAMLLAFFDELDVPVRMLALAGGERWLTNLLHIAELLQATSTRLRLLPNAQLNWLLEARIDDDHCTPEERQLRVESDSQAVLITTIHRSKGLQYPFVICPFLWDGGFESRRPTAVLYRRRSGASGTSDILHLMPTLLDEDGSELRSVRAERMAEAARLAYVAFTRAKHQAVVMAGHVKGFSGTALGQLLFRRDSCGGNASNVPGFSALQETLASESLRVERSVERDGTGELVLPRSVAHTLLEPTAPCRNVRASVHVTSYSALIAQALHHPRAQAAIDLELTSGLGPDLGRDRDVAALSVEEESRLSPPLAFSVPSGAAAPQSTTQTQREALDARYQDALLAEGYQNLPLAALPPGPLTGEALHSTFELMDFPDFTEESALPDVATILKRYGIESVVEEKQLKRALSAVLDVQLIPSQPEVQLRRVTKDRRLVELEFMLELSELNVDRLCMLLGPDVTAMPADYTSQLRQLGFESVSGYLRGFIDLVFELDGRYYVADYKSNRLGDSAADYHGESLRAAMMAHHYPIQAALYAAAVDRWLKMTLADYDYETHFGGVLYLFVRGMHPCLGPGAGVFFHRPSEHAMSSFVAGIRGAEV